MAEAAEELGGAGGILALTPALLWGLWDYVLKPQSVLCSMGTAPILMDCGYGLRVNQGSEVGNQV